MVLRQIFPHLVINNLDQTEIQRAINQGISSGRIPADVKHNTNEEILTSWKLIENGMLTNGALVLFAKEILSRYRQCHLKMGRFIGTNIIGDLLDNREFYGNAFQMLTEANHFIMRHLPIASFFEPDRFERIDKPALPVLAVREALVNAICHRDFANRSSYISVMIFDDRLEIWNNGTLPPELKVNDLKKKHKSVPRNKNISKVFYDRKFFEGWGGGTVTIYNLCREAGLPEPIFEEYSGGLSVTFVFKELIGIPSTSVSPKPPHLTLRQKEILEILTRERKLSFREITNLLENPPAERTLRDDLALLKREELINTEGFGRGARWFYIPKKN